MSGARLDAGETGLQPAGERNLAARHTGAGVAARRRLDCGRTSSQLVDGHGRRAAAGVRRVREGARGELDVTRLNRHKKEE